LSSVNGDRGVQINGAAAQDGLGFSVAAAGDANGDGFGDVIVGSPYAGGTGAGYIIYGGMPAGAVTRVGTAVANVIHGGNFDDTLSGLDGDDHLIGHDGKDKISGEAGGDVLDGGTGNDSLKGGADADTLIGSDGKDSLEGGAAADFLAGGLGADKLNGAEGADRFVYDSAAESTGIGCDKITKADFAIDVWDFSGAVTTIDAQIADGTLRKKAFDTDLAAAADAAHLGAQHAVLFTPDRGTLAGIILLVIDLNGVAGYQTGADLVALLTNPLNIGSLGTEDFI
jgi:Ca2+-binding RTX toxin-like protein